MSASTETRWWWVRHAPVPCPHGQIVGRLDLACDTSDETDFQRLAARLPTQAVVLESGLLRCRQTIGALEMAGLRVAPPIIEPDLIEQDFGLWQGRAWPDIEAAEDAALPAFRADPAFQAPPGGESFARLVERVGAAIARLTAAHAGRDIIAVAHAGTIRAAIAVALGLPPDRALSLVVRPLSLTRLDAVFGDWRIDCVNCG